MGDRGPKYRSVCFTLNSPPEGILEHLREWGQIKYACIGRETGKSGNYHLQGYLEFKDQVWCKTINKKLPGAHIEAPRASSLSNIQYCKKGEQSHEEWQEHHEHGPNYGLNADYEEWGQMNEQGKRTDLETACTQIKNKRPMREIAAEAPTVYVKYHKGLTALRNVLAPKRDEKPYVQVYYGPTGTGKSRTARQTFAGNDFYCWQPQNKTWFDGYDLETHVIFEEFRGQIPLGQLLVLLDRYEARVEVKGGFAQFQGTNIIFTSPKHPKDWYSEDDAYDKIDQLLRRIDKITHFSEKTPFSSLT